MDFFVPLVDLVAPLPFAVFALPEAELFFLPLAFGVPEAVDFFRELALGVLFSVLEVGFLRVLAFGVPFLTNFFLVPVVVPFFAPVDTVFFVAFFRTFFPVFFFCNKKLLCEEIEPIRT